MGSREADRVDPPVHLQPLPIALTYRFRLVWDKAHHHDHRARAIDGLLRAVESETTEGHYLTYWIDARKLLTLLSVSAVLLWLLAAGALEIALARNPYNRVSYFDLALPWRWKDIRDLRGQGYIASGLDEIKAGRIPSGLMELRQGLARHPDAPTARLVAARIYARAAYYRGVREVLLPQLKQSRPPHEYLEFLINAASLSDDHATVVETCDGALNSAGIPAEERNWLLTKKAEALNALERYPEALAALDAAGRDISLEWRRIHIFATCGVSRAADAVAEIKDWSAAVPREFRLQMLLIASRRAGRPDAAQAAARELQSLHPDELQPWALAIGEFERAGWHDAAWTTAQDAIRRFGANAKAMESLERTCSEVRSVDLLSLCLETMREQGQPVLPVLTDLVVAQLRHGELARAEQTYEQVIAEDRRMRELQRNPLGGALTGKPRMPMLPEPVRQWLRTLLDASALPAEDPCSVHITVLENQRIPLALYMVSADVLSSSGHWPAVEALAQQGLTEHPGSTALVHWSKIAGEKIAAMPKPTAASIAAVAPNPARQADHGSASSTDSAMVPAVVKYGTVGQDQFFAKIEDATRRNAWAEVESEIRNVIAAAPPWLPQVQADLIWRQVRAALEQNDALRATLVMGDRLRVRPLEATRALALVHEWQSRTDRETARKLAETLVAAVPEFRPGQAVLAELKKVEKPAAPAGTNTP